MSTYNKLISMTGFAGLIALLTTGACNGTDSPPAGDELTASVGMKVNGPPSNPDFSGNSIRICGKRDPAADNKYFCSSDLSNGGLEPEDCPCFNFDANGEVKGKELKELCPYEDLDENGNPGGTWDFSYYIYTGLDCGGTLMTGAPGTGANPHNLICYDIDDLYTQDNSNQTLDEELNAGQKKENQIICLTSNAKKKFDFDSCAIDSYPNDPTLSLNCGCEFDPNTSLCACDQGFDPYTDLPSNCFIDASLPYLTCNIICTP